MRTRMGRGSGFTLIELLVVVSIIGLLIGILLPALSRAKKQAQQVRDSAQIREIHRGLVNFAQNNRDRFPIPSQMDRLSYTEGPGTSGTPPTPAQLAQQQVQKDRTGAVLSILIYNALITAEQTICPAEAEPGVRRDPDFQYGDISQANGQPNQGLWDPGFVGSGARTRDRYVPSTSQSQSAGQPQPDNPTAGNVVALNNSYAFPPLFGSRLARYWATNYAANDPLMGNRGPEYIQQSPPPGVMWQLQTGASGIASTTLLIHGGKKTWEGNMVYNDGHTAFETTPTPLTVRNDWSQSSSSPVQSLPDNLFWDEQWEGPGQPFQNSSRSRSNAFLRQWPLGLDNSGTNTNPNLQDTATWDGKVQDWFSSF